MGPEQRRRTTRLAGQQSASASGTRITLPTDFDIFSPRMSRKPLCSQYLAMRVDAVGAAALGDLVLVVREDQVEAAAVDVERHAQPALAHGRALDVPAGAAVAPGPSQPGWSPVDGFHSTKSAGSRL